jgi:hypothetical protein|nr:MAG TPA: hypothetical protein [Caudoviricetes sp.]
MRKLSEFGTDECLDVLCEITPHIVNIVSDEEIMNAIGKPMDKTTVTKVGVMLLGAQKITAVVPLLLKTHRADIYAILSVMGGKSVEEVAKQSTMATLWQIKTLSEDKDLLNFFKSWGRGEKSE